MKNNFKELITALHTLETQEEIEKKFFEIAKYLMKRVCVVAGNNTYRIVDCEFYYHAVCHPYPYVHAKDKEYNKYAKRQQSKMCEWYFHDFGTGLDIAIGNGSKNIYGGILIRGVYKNDINLDEENDPYYEGPIITCVELLNSIGSIHNCESSFYIREDQDNICELLRIRRHGLPKDRDNNENYFDKKYRYIDEEYLKIMDGRQKIFEELVDDGKYNIEQSEEKIGWKIKSKSRP